MSRALSMISFDCPRSCAGLIEKSCSNKLKFGMHFRHEKRFKANCKLTSEHSIGQCNYSNLKIHPEQAITRSRVARADSPYFQDDDDLSAESFFINLGKQFLRDIKWALLFLWEQPGELRHIEWPSLQSTLKTTTLTVLLVILLVIFFSSVDSALSFLFASIFK
ncbi:uncharacterized protein LOC131029690 [Cryptomeria japonica]|uniref:uncharacterized protein LOC131029690 n=1 Tax=Cryptomeria japonica TaxID=3369 RepID=UPI0025AB82E7|nr:uncharacterized protein LOC131029690 [Cryptomeria japonica]XP_057816265.1 uncharacterized protein LOC131029690 [Cryptomeria japonica]